MRLYSLEMTSLYESFRDFFRRRDHLDNLVKEYRFRPLSAEEFLKRVVTYYQESHLSTGAMGIDEAIAEINDMLLTYDIVPPPLAKQELFRSLTPRSRTP